MLQVVQPVPKDLARRRKRCRRGRATTRNCRSRGGLKRLYRLTLTLTLLLALLSALGLAFVLSERLSAPLGALVEGTRAVAQGDFTQRAAVSPTTSWAS